MAALILDQPIHLRGFSLNESDVDDFHKQNQSQQNYGLVLAFLIRFW